MKLEDLFHSERLNGQAFMNGDIYIGDFKGASPHGKGKYTWSDGTIYDGDWEEGKITGKGHISYPSGARYDGDFSGGYLHGFGIFTWPDGSIYKGAWRMNIPHGLGRKEYSNLDIYEGSWKEGVHEGNGRYCWSNGNTYIGNWKGGKMCGRGVMKWINGDLFDGLWLNGLRHGSGIHRFADGGFYFGMWSKDVKDGKGTFYPAGSRDLPLKKWRDSLGYDDESIKSNESKSPRSNLKRSISVGGIMRSLSQKSNPKLFSNRFEDLSCDDMSCPSNIGQKCPSDIGQNTSVIYEREYMQGFLVKERARICTKRSQRFKHRNKFHAKEVKKKSCVNLFDSHRSYHLMLDLQLGISPQVHCRQNHSSTST